MDAQLKAKWVEALRSGKYQQARYRLKEGAGLCCIGVGYVVCRGHHPPFSRTMPAAQAIGLTADQVDELTRRNDYDGDTFPEIADYIEANL